MDTPKTVWQYKTNHGPTKALIVDHEGFTVFEIVNHFKNGKRFEDLCGEICRAHNKTSMRLEAERDDLRRVLADTIAELGRVQMQRDELAASLKSIIEWWEDDHDFPYQGAKIDPGEACQWYKRRLMMVANCTRAALAKVKGGN